ncbi:MAG: class I SAM-dependent methyltransferase [Acidobacteria bacterium]|nr:class I SAM-dependent methyltransferase [Acidobacteriota bacterium]
MLEATRRGTCRHCGSADLHTFLDLGETPIANVLVEPWQSDDVDAVYPLDLVFCNACSLVQISHDVPELFPEDYPYYSSVSDHLLRHSADHANGLVETRGLGDKSLVIELASNDGYLLRNFVEQGIPVLGIDPAPGPATAAIEAGVPTLINFFGVDMADDVIAEHGTADVIIANNVMAHVPDLNGFVAGMKKLLAEDGVITVENPYVRDLIEHAEFDTVYHEHFCYYSASSVQAIMKTHDLSLNDVEYFEDLHGGTLRYHIGHRVEQTERVKNYLERERESGMDSLAYYAAFGDRVAGVRRDLRALLERLRSSGATVAAYGAAAKGATLLNYAGIGTDLVEFVVDRNVHKQGKLMPGTHQPIYDTDTLEERKPDFVLLLAWNFKNEIVEQQSAYLEAGGQFIVPVPSPAIVQ